MPYINQKAREQVEPTSSRPAATAGELNYQITRLALQYMNTHGRCYMTFNEIIGVLECAKLEFYRRIIDPHEDYKQRENGDVYT